MSVRGFFCGCCTAGGPWEVSAAEDEDGPLLKFEEGWVFGNMAD
jgi:hypothetical protein